MFIIKFLSGFLIALIIIVSCNVSEWVLHYINIILRDPSGTPYIILSVILGVIMAASPE